jgi:hypothetical protein
MNSGLRDSLAQVQKLKPCPFCGNDVNDDEGCFQTGGFRSYWVVRCGNPSCNAETSAVNREAAITAWNNRHGAGDADRSAELTTAWMAGVERERDRAAHDAEDAARYRWLRSAHGSMDFGFWQVRDFAGCIIGQQPEELDTAIDAARAGERG